MLAMDDAIDNNRRGVLLLKNSKTDKETIRITVREIAILVAPVIANTNLRLSRTGFESSKLVYEKSSFPKE
jgi:hypothetical protein